MRKATLLTVWVFFCAPFLTRAQYIKLDTSFAKIGKVLTYRDKHSAQAFGSALQKDGKIVVAGYVKIDTGRSAFALTRYNSNGSIDSAFGINGTASTLFDSGFNVAYAVAIQPDGKIIAAGGCDPYSYTGFSFHISPIKIPGIRLAMARYNTNGTFDSAFGTNGKVVFNKLYKSNACNLTLQPDNKIVACGRGQDSTLDDFLILRYNADGSLDTSFNKKGYNLSNLSLNIGAQAECIAVKKNGKIIAGGWTYTFSGRIYMLTQYLANGRLDTTFNHSGVVYSTDYNVGTIILSAALQKDNKVIFSGIYGKSYPDTNFFLVTRYDSAGNLDPSYGIKGVQKSTTGAEATSVILDSFGRAYIGGWSGGNNCDSFFLARLTPIGRIDSSFGNKGCVKTAFRQPNAYGLSLLIQPNNKLVLIGYAGVDSLANYFFAIARYTDSLNTGVIDFTKTNNSLLIYPNPIGNADNVKLKYTLAQDGNLSISIYDMQGRVVKNILSNQLRTQGTHIQEFNLSALPASDYLITLNNGIGNFSVRVIKQ